MGPEMIKIVALVAASIVSSILFFACQVVVTLVLAVFAPDSVDLKYVIDPAGFNQRYGKTKNIDSNKY